MHKLLLINNIEFIYAFSACLDSNGHVQVAVLLYLDIVCFDLYILIGDMRDPLLKNISCRWKDILITIMLSILSTHGSFIGQTGIWYALAV